MNRGPASSSSARRVLIADDDHAFRLLLARRLARAGYGVTVMYDGQELLDALMSAPRGFFQAVITDHRMPGLSGLECLAFAGSRAPFVIVSGASDATFRASAKKLGAAAVVPKSGDLDRVVEIVERLAQGASSSPSVEDLALEQLASPAIGQPRGSGRDACPSDERLDP